MNNRLRKPPGKGRREIKMWPHLTNGHIWPPFLITLVKGEWVPVKQIEMNDYGFAGVSKNMGVSGMCPLSVISWGQHKDSALCFQIAGLASMIELVRCLESSVTDFGNSFHFRKDIPTVHRFRVQGSAFRVRDKNKIEDPKSSQKLLVLPHNCQCSVNFQMGMRKPSASHINTPQKWIPEIRMQPWTPESLNPGTPAVLLYQFHRYPWEKSDVRVHPQFLTEIPIFISKIPLFGGGQGFRHCSESKDLARGADSMAGNTI